MVDYLIFGKLVASRPIELFVLVWLIGQDINQSIFSKTKRILTP